MKPNLHTSAQRAEISQAPLTLDDLYDVKALAAAFPAVLTERTIRWQLRSRMENGLAPCCVKVGKKLLVSRSRYEAWLSTRAGA